MKKIGCLLVVLLAMCLQFACGVEMPAVIGRPRAQDGPTQVSVGIWIADITSIVDFDQTAPEEAPSIISVEVLGYDGDGGGDEEDQRKKRRPLEGNSAFR
jgi:hypothetical protein